MKRNKIFSIIEIVLIIVMALGFFLPYFNSSSNTLIKSLGEAYTILGFIFVLIGIVGSIFKKNELSYIACGYFIGVHMYLVATLSRADASFSISSLGLGFYVQFIGAVLTLLFTFIISLFPNEKVVIKEEKRNNAEVKTTVNNGQMNMPVNSFQNIPVEIKEEEKTMPKPDLLAGVKTNDDSLFVDTNMDSGFVTIPDNKPQEAPAGPNINMLNNQVTEPVNTLNINTESVTEAPVPVTEATLSMPTNMIGDVSVSAPVSAPVTEPPVPVAEIQTEAAPEIVTEAAPVVAEVVTEPQTEINAENVLGNVPILGEQQTENTNNVIDQQSLINALTQSFNTGEPVMPEQITEAITEAAPEIQTEAQPETPTEVQTEAITEAPAQVPETVQSMPVEMMGASPLGPVVDAPLPSIDAGLPAPAPEPVEPVEPTVSAEAPVSMLGPQGEMNMENIAKTPENMLGNGPIPGPAEIPQGMPPMPPQGMAPQGMPPMPPQGMPPQCMPPMPQQGMPPQGMPPMNNMGGVLGGLPTPSQEGGQDIYNIMNREPSMEEQMRMFEQQHQLMNNNNNQAAKPDLLAGSNLSGILGN